MAKINGQTNDKKKKMIITDYIDFNLSGRNYEFTNLTLAPFVAGFLQEMMSSSCFKSAVKPLQERVKHLSFLVHLACRFDDFNTVVEHYKDVNQDLETGLASWEDDNYFRSWEQRILTDIFFTADHITDEGEHHSDRVHDYNAAFEPKIEVDTNSNFDVIDNEVYENGDCKVSDEEYVPENDIENKASRTPAKKYIKRSKSSEIKLKKRSTMEDLKEFESTKKIKKKTQIYESKKSLFCNSCDFTSKHQKRYDKHMFEKHEQTLCSICGMNFETFESFTVHVEAHMPEKCDVCHKSFKNKDFLKKHTDSTHNKTAKEMCPVCGKIYKNVANHVRIAHEYMTKQCPHCPYSSKISTDLNRHIQRTHTEETVTTCPYCAKTTKNIKRHLKINKCDRPEEKVFAHIKCDRCDKTFSSKEHMKRHIKRIHDKILDVHCLQCDYKTYSNFNLRIHVTRVHEGKQLKQSCPYCQQSVISLDWHIKMYHVEKANSKVEVDTDHMEGVLVGMNGNQSISIPTSYLSA